MSGSGGRDSASISRNRSINTPSRKAQLQVRSTSIFSAHFFAQSFQFFRLWRIRGNKLLAESDGSELHRKKSGGRRIAHQGNLRRAAADVDVDDRAVGRRAALRRRQSD